MLAFIQCQGREGRRDGWAHCIRHLLPFFLPSNDPFSARLGRPTPFTALVIDCEHCWGQLRRDEAAFLRSPQLTHIFYELDEKSTHVVEQICSFGFGVVSSQIDCLLPRSNLAQLVFKRDPSLPCLDRPMERAASCLPTC